MLVGTLNGEYPWLSSLSGMLEPWIARALEVFMSRESDVFMS